MMQMMMAQNGMAAHVEGRIAFKMAELKITDVQQPRLDAVADAMRANANYMTSMVNCISMMQSSATLPVTLATCEKAATAHLQALRKLKTAVEPIYAALGDDQKETPDQLMIAPTG